MDPDFLFDRDGLARAVEWLGQSRQPLGASLPGALPETGLGAHAALEWLGPRLLGGAADLGAPGAFAHMDPPTPWFTWAAALWNAALNQNLLHPATAPVARDIEARVVGWLAPFFGMDGGHMTPGSTVANLTALWAARECAGVDEVVASVGAHLSVAKAAHLLGLRLRTLPVGADGVLQASTLGDALEGDQGHLRRAALVLTAGTTASGAIDPLGLAGRAAWTHVDAAWAGPLCLSRRHAPRLAGIEHADSVAVSAHKWLFQPKESALVLFRDTARAHAAVSFDGAYLAAPNVGVLGSHGAAAVPLLATLLAWGRQGLAQRIDRCMALAEQLAQAVRRDPRLVLYAEPSSGVVLWRPLDEARLAPLLAALPAGMVSSARIDGVHWLRQVAANPNADIALILQAIDAALR